MGNDLMGDDAVGLQVIRRVRQTVGPDTPFDIHESTESGLALLDEFTGFDRVWMVDSILTGRFPAGHLHRFPAHQLPITGPTRLHGLGVGDTLRLGQLLGLPMPRGVDIFAIEIADPYVISDRLSPRLQLALPNLVTMIIDSIRCALSEEHGTGRR
ncbi:MAG: hydrogenase maturation protease [Verrucomicrobiales bacterium]|nr:hydrogenase maturation protease [Verrucomicrobiales bacterium]